MSGMGGYVWGGWVCLGWVGMSRGWVPTHQLLKLSGGYHTYGQQAGGMHPTRMLSCYCPQMKFAKVMFLQVSVCPQGHAWQGCAWWGGAWQGVCMVGVCMAGGACMVGGMCGRGHAWQGGMHGRAACMAGVYMVVGCMPRMPPRQIL